MPVAILIGFSLKNSHPGLTRRRRGLSPEVGADRWVQTQKSAFQLSESYGCFYKCAMYVLTI